MEAGKVGKVTKFKCVKHYYINSDWNCQDCRREIRERKQRKLLERNTRVMELLDNTVLTRAQLKLAIGEVLIEED